MSAVISLPLPTEFKARLVTWLVLLLVVLVSAILLWMGTLLSFAIANLLFARVFGYGFDDTGQALFIGLTGTACAMAGLFAYLCLLKGTLRHGS